MRLEAALRFSGGRLAPAAQLGGGAAGAAGGAGGGPVGVGQRGGTAAALGGLATRPH